MSPRACILCAFLLTGCVAPRVAPVGTVTPDPQHPGAYVLNQALPQPVAEDYQPGQGGGFLAALGTILPGPWGTIVSVLGSVLVAAPLARRGPLRALQQTVDGIENAKGVMGEFHVEALHHELAKTQDDDTKRTVAEMRP